MSNHLEQCGRDRNHNWDIDALKDSLSEFDRLAQETLDRLSNLRGSVTGYLREEMAGIIDDFCMNGCCYLGQSSLTPIVTCIEVKGNAMAIEETWNKVRELLWLLADKAEAIQVSLQGETPTRAMNREDSTTLPYFCAVCHTPVCEEETVYCYDARHLDHLPHRQPCPCCMQCTAVMRARCRFCEGRRVTADSYSKPQFWTDLREDRKDAKFRRAYFWASVRIWLVDSAAKVLKEKVK